jgi:hypothetical protein
MPNLVESPPDFRSCVASEVGTALGSIPCSVQRSKIDGSALILSKYLDPMLDPYRQFFKVTDDLTQYVMML